MGNTINQKYEKLTISRSPELIVRHQSAKGSPKGSIIFVHGICHGAWCFENFMDFFSKNGYECFALNLRGHGDNPRKDLKGAKLSDYRDDVKKCIDYCTKYLNKREICEKPFLLGHSMGGAVVQKYIGEYSNTIKGAILFASATAPKMCFLETLITTFSNYHLFFASLVAYGCKKKCIIDNSAFSTGKDKNGNRIQRVKSTDCFQLLHKEPLRVIFINLHSKYTNNHSVNIPILVTGSYADLYFPEKSLKKTAKIYRCSEEDTRKHLKILPDLCHDMMLDEVDEGWKGSAEEVLKFMENNK